MAKINLVVQPPDAGATVTLTISMQQCGGRSSRRAMDKKLKAVASRRISFHQEIGNESLQESADETDHQYHLPSQAAAGKIGIPDCEGRMPEAISKSRTPAEITPIRRRNRETYQKAGGGHIVGICAPVPLRVG